MNEENIAVIIPAYNEEITIRDVILGFHRELPTAKICVVNNKSTDATVDIARKCFDEIGSGLGQILQESKQGKAFALKRAFEDVQAEIYVMADADLGHDPIDVKKLINPIIQGKAEIVLGNRHANGDYKNENKRYFNGVGNHLVRTLINFLFNAKLGDIMCGYRAMSRSFVKNYPVLCGGFEIETEMVLHMLHNNYSYIELPIRFRDRPEGSSSKLNTIRDGVKVIYSIFTIFRHYKPLWFFGFAGLANTLLGVYYGVLVLGQYSEHGKVTSVSTAILSVGFVIVSLLLYSIALILDSIGRYQRFNYELRKYDTR